jgi:cytochrome c peroxidase
MKKGCIYAAFVVIVSVFLSCFGIVEKSTRLQAVDLYKKQVQELALSVETLAEAIAGKEPTQLLQESFKRAKESYKRVEWLVAYYHEFTAKQINGPAIEEIEPEDNSVLLKPEGFQVVEALLFPTYDTASRKELLQQAKMLQSSVGRLSLMATTLETTDAHLFDAMRLQVFRLITLGITGFDSPNAKNSIAETAASLHGMEEVLSLYAPSLQNKNKERWRELHTLFSSAAAYLSRQPDFDGLDRMHLIKTYLNPLSAALLAAQKTLGFSILAEPRALAAGASTLFSASLFDADFYKPDAAAAGSEAKRVLGEKLFYDAVLSDKGKRSCASCHQPQRAFTDGLKQNVALNSQIALRRNTPTLLYAALQPAQFYDMRVSFLEDQAAAVITNKDEMHGSLTIAKKRLSQNNTYRSLFSRAFATDTISEAHIKNALATYLRSLTPFQSRFDAFMQGKDEAMNSEEINGFNLFMGKAGCGTCHFAPLFNGVNPPQFTKVDAEIIGVPQTRDTLRVRLDKDEGKYLAYKIPLHRFAFKTPTLRNIEKTAPYMHNGVYRTLEEVIDFYDRGGGAGMGYNVPGQTLPAEKLNLTQTEKNALVAFLNTLTDKVYTKN